MSGSEAPRAVSARPPGSQRFPKAMRLLERRDFVAVQRTGKTFHGRHFLVVVAPRTSAGRVPGRLGITTSKKVGKAVVRNRIRRLVREYVRRHDWLPVGLDVVVIAKRRAAELRHYRDVAAELERLGSRLAPSPC
ncbi:ribonuclease P protein component [Haliangium sp.]|uniref:ribonuclease P protein component n=1 Tax=Haliangium sp. TaxID=2663208 RepID=UPI003D0F8AC3